MRACARLARPALVGIGLFLLLARGASAQAPAAGGVLDGLVQDYQTHAATWLERIIPLAQRTFALLAVLEFAVSGIGWALGRDALDAVFAALLKKFILLSFLYSLLYTFPLWIPEITHGFEVAGQTASGSSAVNPSQVFDLGISIASQMLLSGATLQLIFSPAGTFIIPATAFFVVLAYAAIAAQICVTLIETLIVLSGGCLFLGFAGFRGTAPFAESYILYAFRTGTKLYLLYLLLGVGTALSRQWAVLTFLPELPGFGPSLAPHFQVLCAAITFSVLVWVIPGPVASRLTQGAGFRLQDALR